jgi:hypothetical protein
MKQIEKTFWATRNLKTLGKSLNLTNKSMEKSFDSRSRVKSPMSPIQTCPSPKSGYGDDTVELGNKTKDQTISNIIKHPQSTTDVS